MDSKYSRRRWERFQSSFTLHANTMLPIHLCWPIHSVYTMTRHARLLQRRLCHSSASLDTLTSSPSTCSHYSSAPLLLHIIHACSLSKTDSHNTFTPMIARIKVVLELRAVWARQLQAKVRQHVMLREKTPNKVQSLPNIWNSCLRTRNMAIAFFSKINGALCR
jgi:hypothetical protein